MDYSVHPPSPFIQTHWQQLVPTWSQPVGSLLIVLQSSLCSFLDPSANTTQQKQQLRQQFLEFGRVIAHQLQQKGYLAEVFDPCNGLPTLSPPGSLHLDDVAVVRNCLGYPTLPFHGCIVILHPRWGGSTYPSTLMSSASPEVLQQVVDEVTRSQDKFGWLTDLPSDLTSPVEYETPALVSDSGDRVFEVLRST